MKAIAKRSYQRGKYMEMREVSISEYLEFVARKGFVEIEGQKIELKPIEVSRLEPTREELTDISTTVWSFPERGSWATHRGDYRGNWPPQIPRALILMYTSPGDLVLDPMVGSGTTLIEAKLLGRRAIGVDINYDAVMLTIHRMYWLEQALKQFKSRVLLPKVGDLDVDTIINTEWKVYHGDARRLTAIPDESVDLVATHPPYFNTIEYGSGLPGDLSSAKTLEEYLDGIEEIANECFRVLKPGKYCAILIGDTRIHRHYVPLSYYVLNAFLRAGFILKEEVIKIQHKMKITREVWQKIKERDFLLIYHEKLFIFRKPQNEEERIKLRHSAGLKLK